VGLGKPGRACLGKSTWELSFSTGEARDGELILLRLPTFVIQLVKVAIDVLVPQHAFRCTTGWVGCPKTCISQQMSNKTELLPEMLAAHAGRVPDKASRAT